MTKRLTRTPPKKAKSKELKTRREIANEHDVHLQTVTKWEQQGLPVVEPGRKGKPSLFDPDAVKRWLENREKTSEKSGVADLARERALKERAYRIAAEQRSAITAGELVRRGDAEKALIDEMLRARSALVAWERTLPHRVARAYELSGERGVALELRRAVEEVLNDLAKTDDLETPKPKAAAKKRTAKKKSPKKKRTAKKRS